FFLASEAFGEELEILEHLDTAVVMSSASVDHENSECTFSALNTGDSVEITFQASVAENRNPVPRVYESFQKLVINTEGLVGGTDYSGQLRIYNDLGTVPTTSDRDYLRRKSREVKYTEEGVLTIDLVYFHMTGFETYVSMKAYFYPGTGRVDRVVWQRLRVDVLSGLDPVEAIKQRVVCSHRGDYVS
ncbi:MAG: hypothetical protein AAF202_04570, partial [Pseudomonadota bacterium]